MSSSKHFPPYLASSNLGSPEKTFDLDLTDYVTTML